MFHTVVFIKTGGYIRSGISTVIADKQGCPASVIAASAPDHVMGSGNINRNIPWLVVKIGFKSVF